MKKQLVALLLCSGMLLPAAGCGASPEAEIQDLNDEFCRSFNHLDMDSMIECLEPDLADYFNSMMDLTMGLTSGLIGAMTDVDIDLESDLLYDFVEVYFGLMPEESREAYGLPELEMELESLEFSADGQDAWGTALFTITQNGQSQSAEAGVYYTRIDRQWYYSMENMQGYGY